MPGTIELTPEHLILREGANFPVGQEYQPQNLQKRSKPNVHAGQKKLLMSEIQLLTNAYSQSEVDITDTLLVVYAGANPCDHLGELLEMFPNVCFVLVDPAFPRLQKHAWPPTKVAVCSRAFDVEAAEAVDSWSHNNKNRSAQDLGRHFIHTALDQLKFPDGWELKRERNLLFVSDVRIHHADDRSIDNDMFAQQHWCKIIRPMASLLKFRLPYVVDYIPPQKAFSYRPQIKARPYFEKTYPTGQYPYMKGDVYMPIWGPPSTTECRLYVTNANIDTICMYYPAEHEKKWLGSMQSNGLQCIPTKGLRSHLSMQRLPRS